MKKPIFYDDLGYDIHELVNYVGKKCKMNPMDFHNSSPHFDTWCDAQGFGKKDADGKKRSASNIWFAQYEADPQGEAACPEYEDFFGWFLTAHSIGYEESVSFHVDNILEDPEISPTMKIFLGHIQKYFGNEVQCFMSEA